MIYYKQCANKLLAAQSIGLNEVVKDVRRVKTDSAADPGSDKKKKTPFLVISTARSTVEIYGVVSIVFPRIH